MKMTVVEKVTGVFGLVVIAVVLTIIVSWIGNIYKLTQCDFASPYKGEVVHAIGIIPLAAPFTVWCDAK